MDLKMYQVDAFADKLFEGNPAAVCPLEKWLSDDQMQSIAMENNLSETAFYVPTQTGYHIRWFTPTNEVELCGHATLASAYVLFNVMGFKEDYIEFQSRSGILTVTKKNEWLVMDFPAQPPVSCDMPDAIVRAFSDRPAQCLKSEDYLVTFDYEAQVISAIPNLAALTELGLRAVIITAPSAQYDFVCRVFAPKYGIAEDPVTGSAFTQLAPFWSTKLGKSSLFAKQVSMRGGEVTCELVGDRVLISGKAVMYLEGIVQIED